MAGLDKQWIYILQLETPPPPTSFSSSPDPSTAKAQRVWDSLISDLGLNCNAFLGNLYSSGKGQQILCVPALPPLEPLQPAPSFMSSLQRPLPLVDHPPPHPVFLCLALSLRCLKNPSSSTCSRHRSKRLMALLYA